MGIRRQIYLSDEQDAAIKAAAGKNEEPAAYIRRVALEHAAGEWKGSGAAEFRDAVAVLQKTVAAADVTTEPAIVGRTLIKVSDQARQLKHLTDSTNILIKIALDMQAKQQTMLASSKELTAAVEGALL
jgi:hypothetical protein